MTTRQSSYNYEEILSCGRGELFGPGNAQLPLPPMLMVHRITDISETGGAFDKGYIRAEYDVKPDDWYFPCHFQGNPIMPGCLGLDGMWQLTGFFLGWLGSVTSTRKEDPRKAAEMEVRSLTGYGAEKAVDH